jgi:hypothetical protein
MMPNVSHNCGPGGAYPEPYLYVGRTLLHEHFEANQQPAEDGNLLDHTVVLARGAGRSSLGATGDRSLWKFRNGL